MGGSVFSRQSLDIIKGLVAQVRLAANDPELVAKATAIATLNSEIDAAIASVVKEKNQQENPDGR